MAKKKETTEIKAKGRPTKYNAQFHPMLVEALASKGLTNPQIAEKMNIAESTLGKWMVDHQDFSDAIKRGREEPDDKVEKTLFELATGYEHNVTKPVVVGIGKGYSEVELVDYTEKIPPNVTAQIFWLKNRRPARWMEKTTNVNLNLNKDASDLTPEEEDAYRNNMRAAFPLLDIKE